MKIRTLLSIGLSFVATSHAQTEETSMKVMTYNVFKGGLGRKEPLSQTAKVIQHAKADVVGLQELNTRSDPKNAEKLAELLGFNRAGSVLTRYEIVEEKRYGIKVKLPSGQEAYIFNLHLSSNPYQPYQLMGIRPKFKGHKDTPFIKTEAEAIEGAQKARTHGTTLKRLFHMMGGIDKNIPIFVVGDFNEPSHLDWTEAAAKAGRHPMKVEFPTSKVFAKAGFTDSYRTIYPDEMKNPGITWSPAYKVDDPKTHHDRIDFVYFKGEGLKVTEVKIVGENKENADIVVSPYPSDHRAVVATFTLPNPSKLKKLDADKSLNAHPQRWQHLPSGIFEWDLTKSHITEAGRIEMHGEEAFLSLGIPHDHSGFDNPAFTIGYSRFRGRYSRRTFELGNEMGMPTVMVDSKHQFWEKPQKIQYDGMIHFVYPIEKGLSLKRTIFPSARRQAVIQQWTLTNHRENDVVIEVVPEEKECPLPENFVSYETEPLYGGSKRKRGAEIASPNYNQLILSDGLKRQKVNAKQSVTFHKTILAYPANSPRPKLDMKEEWNQRQALWNHLQNQFELITPDKKLNGAFRMAALRMLEANVRNAGGVMNTTGTKNYYNGVWANDNIEYTGAAYSHIGFPRTYQAIENNFRFWQNDPENFSKKIMPWGALRFIGSYEGYSLRRGQHKRGDEAMVLYGLGLMLLGEGDEALARELYPLLLRSVATIESAMDKDGVFHSPTDELEQRYPSGNANLANNCLAYKGARLAAKVARSLGENRDENHFISLAKRLEHGIEHHFGDVVEGFQTYQYFRGECDNSKVSKSIDQTTLRGWICMPLVAGIQRRREETLRAMFSDKLWVDNPGKECGLKPASLDRELGCWPRQSYYGILAGFMAEAPDTTYLRLRSMLELHTYGAQGPYIDEDGGDLLSPSALLVRAVIEGVWGIDYLSFNEVAIRPQIPKEWNSLQLKGIRLCGRVVDLKVMRIGKRLDIQMFHKDELVRPSSQKAQQATFNLSNLPRLKLEVPEIKLPLATSHTRQWLETYRGARRE